MKNDPVNTQAAVRFKFGRQSVLIQAPPDIDPLLEECIERSPNDVDSIPYYAFLWPAAQGLARYIHAKRTRVAGKRVIELGCGLGLPSIVAAQRGAQVLATDFHAGTESWLQRNAQANDVELAFHTYDWNEAFEGVSFESAEIVLGSDLLYEKRHIPALVCSIERLTLLGGEAWIADPGREGLEIFERTMVKAGWKCELAPDDDIFILRCRRSKK